MDEGSTPPRHGRISLKTMLVMVLAICIGTALIRLGIVVGDVVGLAAILAGLGVIIGTIQFLLIALIRVR